MMFECSCSSLLHFASRCTVRHHSAEARGPCCGIALSDMRADRKKSSPTVTTHDAGGAGPAVSTA
jgi:hypothetical protein